jgi:acyl-CoA synthetase (AMP-forming)/AMP-acid ligase II/aryl carrier-like protein
VLAPGAVAAVQAALPGCTVINGYGPTENTTFTCCFPVPRPWPATVPLPIGRPIPYTRVAIRDAHGAPVPVGVAGELYAGGDGVALGYLNRPALTAERFVSDAAGERWYRTGDRARWRADGVVEFLGRLDQQVKLRGYRVEPGEVEATLRQSALVRDVAVVVQTRSHGPHMEKELVAETAGEKELVAYVVLAPDLAPDLVPDANDASNASALSPDAPRAIAAALEALRAFARAQLPSYMVPAALVPLPTIPLTPAGKLDRRALPAVETERLPTASVAPRTALEARIAAIWCDVLKRGTVGVTDRLFDIGGHSLAAMRIAARMQDVFGGNVTLQSLFERPTVAQLAEMVAAAPASIAAPAGGIQRAARAAYRRPAGASPGGAAAGGGRTEPS